MIYAKYVNDDVGYPCDIAKCKKFLKLNKMYAVESIDVGMSSTTIYLKNYYGCWNSVNFEFYKKVDGKYVEYDPYHDPQLSPYTRGKNG